MMKVKRRLVSKAIDLGLLTRVTALKLHEKWTFTLCKLRVFVRFFFATPHPFTRFLQAHTRGGVLQCLVRKRCWWGGLCCIFMVSPWVLADTENTTHVVTKAAKQVMVVEPAVPGRGEDPRRSRQEALISTDVSGYVQLSPVQDLLFASADAGARASKPHEVSESLCLYSNAPGGEYTVEALTDTGDFRLRGPGSALEYRVFWRHIGEKTQTVRVPLQLGRPLHLWGADITHLDCAGKRNVRVTVALTQPAAVRRARASQYGSVLTLVIGQE